MIRAIIFTALGFWWAKNHLQRVYENRKKERETTIRQRLITRLVNEGWHKDEAEQAVDQILK